MVAASLSQAVLNICTMGLWASNTAIKAAANYSFGTKFFSWASATVIRFLISLAVSKIYSWQYSGLLARARISDPIRWHNWPLILNMQGPWPSLTAFMTLTPMEVIANMELYRLMLSKKCLERDGDSLSRRRSRGCGGAT